MSNVYHPEGLFQAVGNAFEADMSKLGVKILNTGDVNGLLSKIKMDLRITSIEEGSQ